MSSVLDRLVSPEHVAKMAARRAANEEREKAARLAEIEARREKLWEERGIRYRACSLENFVASSPRARKVVAALKAYRDDLAANVAAGKGIILTGFVGTGKDHLLASLFDRAIDAGFTLKWTSGARLQARLRDGIGSAEDELLLLRQYTAPDILVLSDPMPISGELTQYQRTCLYAIIDQRYNDQQPVWCSINAAGRAEADERIGAAIVDRLVDGALSLVCDWPSYRKAAR